MTVSVVRIHSEAKAKVAQLVEQEKSLFRLILVIS
jgi:hypothetical protein